MADVEIFSGPGCSQCEAAKRLLAQHGVPFIERSVADETELEEFRQRLPRVSALPQIFVDGGHIGSTEDLQRARTLRRPPFDI